MNAIKWKTALCIIISVIVGVFCVNWLISDKVFSIQFLFDSVGKSVSIMGVLSGLFCMHLWKYKIFHNWLVLVPNLSGKWEGYIFSDWIDESTGEPLPPISTTLIIKQNLFKTSCVIKTGESSSHSIVSNFLIDEENQVLKLVYIYQNEPKQNIQDRSRMHYGSTVLNIYIRKDSCVLDGYYWTNRNTSGQLNFTRQTKEP